MDVPINSPVVTSVRLKEFTSPIVLENALFGTISSFQGTGEGTRL
jgi:hypothetical protein